MVCARASTRSSGKGSDVVEVRIDVRATAILAKGELRKDWGPVAARVAADQGRWRFVLLQNDGRRGIAREVREHLAAAGCRAQVVGLVGLGEAPRPWNGIAVFARVRGPYLGM